MSAFYSQEEVQSRLVFHEGWSFVDNSIRKSFAFKDFVRAFAFISMVALEAERLGHHPDWSNSYNRVTISLSTHEAGGVTDKDFTLAERIDKYAG